MKLRCGLLGRTLGHSYSPQIHALLGDYSYEIFEREPEEVEEFCAHGPFDGCNVTMPYKKAVFPFCDEVSDMARELESINTLVRRADGTLYGDNTDAVGFASLVKHSGIDPNGKKCLVLGNGGASVTVCAILRKLGGEVVVISRSGEDNYENLERHADARVIVNTTPLGMYPKTGVAAVDLRRFPQCEGVLDIVYNPRRTALLLQAEELGIPNEGGLYMLVAQAKRASELFCSTQIEESEIERITGILSRRAQNIVLIGMPGCGKSSAAQLLAEKTGRPILDCDAEIALRAGKSIPEIFAEEGEEGFRRRETEVLADFGKQSGAILATGGGCVTREENYPLLHQNGVIFHLLRDCEKLPTDGRPISQANDLRSLFERRRAMYERFADVTVDNNASLLETVERILEEME